MSYNVLQISEGKAFKNENLILKINIIMKTKMSNYRNCFALAYVLLAVVFFIGCTEVNTDRKNTEFVVKGGNSPLIIVEVDSCEYLLGEWGNATVLTHKGNCKFCLARSVK